MLRCGQNISDKLTLSALEKEELRNLVRRRRSKLSFAEQRDAQHALAKYAARCGPLRTARRILSYVPVGGEISPESIVAQLHDTVVFLPRIVDYEKHSMQFYPAANPRTRNRFNIDEPVAEGVPLDGRELDAVLVPLLLFDRTGTRAGMGGGYYDRAFALRLSQPEISHPYLIGIAHHFQEVSRLVREPWDVPLDAIITDHELIELC